MNGRIDFYGVTDKMLDSFIASFNSSYSFSPSGFSIFTIISLPIDTIEYKPSLVVFLFSIQEVTKCKKHVHLKILKMKDQQKTKELKSPLTQKEKAVPIIFFSLRRNYNC